MQHNKKPLIEYAIIIARCILLRNQSQEKRLFLDFFSRFSFKLIYYSILFLNRTNQIYFEKSKLSEKANPQLNSIVNAMNSEKDYDTLNFSKQT